MFTRWIERLQKLPREGRDALFLLAVITWILLPLMSHLPLWCSAVALGVITWRAILAVSGQPLPSRWWLLAVLALTVLATALSFRSLLGRDPGVTMIAVLLSMKTLELRARRDAFVVFFLGFFTLLTNFFFSQSLLTAAAMLIALLGLLTALVNAHLPVGKPPLWQAARIAGSMALLGAPIMLVLFVLFPRVAPLWGVPGDAMSGRSGLSASMQVGNIASLALDDGIAFRIRFEGTVPPASDLYFRGPVLSTLEGREWRTLRSALPARLRLPAELEVFGAGLKYQVTLEPSNRPWLMLLDATPTRPALPGFDASMTAQLQWIADRPITDLVRYSATSYTSFRHGPRGAVAGLQDELELPSGYNPRTLELAAQWKGEARNRDADAQRWVALVLEQLRSGGYSYTLEPGVFGQHSADEFWFDRKQGFCEHIASSFVILMRALGVPARVVTGYQGGETNPVDGYFEVRQSDAHAWAEVWQAGRGWMRVDPTAAVAPGRVGALQRLQAPRGRVATALFGNVNPALALNLRALWNAVNNSWNQRVLNYTQSKQLELLRNLGFKSPDWTDLSYLLIGLVVLASLLGAAWTRWERSRQDPWLRLLGRAARHLREAGLPVTPHPTPRQLARVLGAGGANAGLPVMQFQAWLLRLEELRYARASHASGALATLRRELRTLMHSK